MDAQNFDEVIRSLSSGASRRSLFAALAALSLAPAGQDAAAKNNHKKRKNTKRPRQCVGKECSGKCGNCRDGKICQKGSCVCPDETEECGGKCVNVLTDAAHCGVCNTRCPGAEGCRHGTCTCDPFNNTCPLDETPFMPGDRCGCGAVTASQFVAACVDGNSACDLDKPCDNDNDCPSRSVCLLGCADASDPDGPRRCSTPCN